MIHNSYFIRKYDVCQRINKYLSIHFFSLIVLDSKWIFFKAFRSKWVLRGLSPSLVVIITTDQLMGFTNIWARHSTNRPADCRAVLKLRLLFAHKCINRNVKKASKSDHKLINPNKIYMAVIRILYTIQRTKKWSNISISKEKVELTAILVFLWCWLCKHVGGLVQAGCKP